VRFVQASDLDIRAARRACQRYFRPKITFDGSPELTAAEAAD